MSNIGVSRSSAEEASKGVSIQLEKNLALSFLLPDLRQLSRFSCMFLKVLRGAFSSNLPFSFTD